MSPRGAGWLFGESITKEFMEVNSLNLLCRAHQLVDEGICTSSIYFVVFHLSYASSEFLGFKFMFDNLLVTVWSAPNYCYRCGNVAAILEMKNATSREAKIFKEVSKDNRVVPSKFVTPYFL